jgi:UDP-3-O-[3-hydroxymyristoyl] glucosamine N-acyltransferase
MIRVEQLLKDFKDSIGSITGDKTAAFQKVSSFDSATTESLVFVHNDKLLPNLLTTNARVIVVADKLKDKVTIDANKTYIFAKKSDVLVAHILQKYFAIDANTSVSSGIHSTVICGTETEIQPTAKIGPFVVIGSRVKIGKNVSIGANTFVADDVTIEDNVSIDASNYIGPKSFIYKNVRIQSQNTIGAEPYCYDTKGAIRNAASGVTLEIGVELGAGNVIERGLTNDTRICTGTKLDNRIFIGSESRIGPHSFLTAGLRISHNVTTGHHFVCGGGTHIEPNINICDMVQVAGISCVTHDITSPGAYGGFPLQNMKDYLRTTMTLTKIPELRKDIAKLMQDNDQ